MLREGHEIYRGKIESLKHLKDEVQSIEVGKECGIRLDNEDMRFEVDDEIVSIETRKEEQQTAWNPGF